MKRSDITTIFPEATEEQVKSLMDIHGADLNAAKGNLDDLKKELATATATIAELQKSTAAEDLAKATERADALQTELDGLKHAEQIRQIREGVAKGLGVPAHLLTGEDEQSCTEQAKAIMEFARPKGYPAVKDGGEPNLTPHQSTRDQFAEWINSVSK